MVRTVFNHLKTLKPPPEEPATATLDATEPAVAHMDPAGVTLGGVESETPKAEEKQLEAIEGEKGSCESSSPSSLMVTDRRSFTHTSRAQDQ
jgi:hypothetical protein